MLAAACGIALWRGRPLDAAAAVVVVAGANLTTQVLKVALAHPRFQSVLGARPARADRLPQRPRDRRHLDRDRLRLRRRARVAPGRRRVGVCFVAAVGCSVMVLAWHFPSDVLGGILVASGWGFAVLALRRVAEGGAASAAPAQASSRPAISVK